MAALNELLRRGVAVGRLFHHADPEGLVGGANPQRKGYASYASFSDPGRCCESQSTGMHAPALQRPGTRVELLSFAALG
jgi:hypothetical protein